VTSIGNRRPVLEPVAGRSFPVMSGTARPESEVALLKDWLERVAGLTR
jgi:hypothetical protein